MSENLDLVRRGWEAALRGDLDAVAALLAEDVRWHAAGYEDAGCQNRSQALGWMRGALKRGGATVRELRELDENRVMVVLQRPDAPEPHAQVVTVRDGKITEMVVHPTPEAALTEGRRDPGTSGGPRRRSSGPRRRG